MPYTRANSPGASHMPRTILATILTTGALLLGVACQMPVTSAYQPPVEPLLRAMTYVPDLPLSHPPYDEVHVSWKQRLDAPFVFLEHFGSYTETGSLIPALHRELIAQGLEPDGPPFCLFYDNPSKTPVNELRSRACIPVRGPRTILAPLHYEVLPSTTVGYAFVTGLYPDAPRAFPPIFAYLRRMRWERNGPIRLIYLVPPGVDPDPESLLCEIQVPASPGIH